MRGPRHRRGQLDGRRGGTLENAAEDWTAEFSMEEFFDGGYKGDATFEVQVSGTDTEGCTYAGGGEVTGTAEMTIWEYDDPAESYYSVTLQKKAGSFPVSVSCADGGTHTEDWYPLQYADLMRTYDYPFYEPGMVSFTGADQYRTSHYGYDFAVDWSWDIG